MAAAPARVGEYELIAKLGEGGMGAVYQARQISLDRIVALKVLPRRLAADQEFVQRFLREARATARLSHPNIVAGIDVNCADGYYYFAMEYIEGKPLGQRLKDEGPLPESEVLKLGAAIASALAHAHKAGIIHRDVKPDNILLDAMATPKLADLGLAKTIGSSQDVSVTQSGSAVGTPHYMSPEQVRGQINLDGRTDVYSLGCTLYHAATGRTPYLHEVPAVLMTKHLTEKMAHPQALRPDLSDQFCSILAHMLAREPADRYAGIEQAAQDMELVLGGHEPTCGPMPLSKANFALTTSGRTTKARGLPAVDRTSRRVPAASNSAAGGSDRQRALPAQEQGQPQGPQRRWMTPTLIGSGVLLAVILAGILLSGSHTQTAEVGPVPGANAPRESTLIAPAPLPPPPSPIPAVPPAKDGPRPLAAPPVFRPAAGLPHFDGEVTPQVVSGKLVGLKLKGPRITDLSALRGYALKELDISETRVADLSPLKGMPLESLTINSTLVTDLSPLKGMALKDFSCATCYKLRDISALKGMPLERLIISYTSVADLSVVQNMPLKDLRAAPIKTGDYSAVKNLKLRCFILDYDERKHKELLKSMTTLDSINWKPAKEFWRDQDKK